MPHSDRHSQHSSPLTALSPLDGRYARTLAPLRDLFSEYGLIRHRLLVEIRWLEQLSRSEAIPEVTQLSEAAHAYLDRLLTGFSEPDAEKVKTIEARTNHDVKAVEYFLKEAIATEPELEAVSEFVHFACTSEDINNLAYALMLKTAREDLLIPKTDQLIDALSDLAETTVDLPMLARTHGQPASPTTLGKEIANVIARLHRARLSLAEVTFFGKMNGAVGNFNAHLAAYPEADWPEISSSFVRKLDIVNQPMTTQIEPHDCIAEFCHALIRLNLIVLDLDRDLWLYIALGYFKQHPTEGEVGSSTMPHKVNPIDFENAEGNIGLANALLAHLAEKLPVSRWQRDLSDSTALRNLGSALGYTILALESTCRGLSKLTVDTDRLAEDLNDAWEVLAEAVQTVMRRHGLPQPYEQLKALTRGQAGITAETLHGFIENLALPDDVRHRLCNLTPTGYTGLAVLLAEQFLKDHHREQ